MGSTGQGSRNLANEIYICAHYTLSWVKVFRIIPEFKILRLTFHRKSVSNAELGIF